MEVEILQECGQKKIVQFATGHAITIRKARLKQAKVD